MLILKSDFNLITAWTAGLFLLSQFIIFIIFLFVSEKIQKRQVCFTIRQKIISWIVVPLPLYLFVLFFVFFLNTSSLWIIENSSSNLVKIEYYLFGSKEMQITENKSEKVKTKYKQIIINRTMYKLFIEKVAYGNTSDFFQVESYKLAEKYALNSLADMDISYDDIYGVEPASVKYFGNILSYFGYDEKKPPERIEVERGLFEKDKIEKKYWLRW